MPRTDALRSLGDATGLGKPKLAAGRGERRPAGRARDSGNTQLSRDFPVGVLVMTGANSAVGLRSMTARCVFLDEDRSHCPSLMG
ncbi:MAG: phage terminase large subunit family protein, partial [Roseicyclus sp.]